MPNWADKIAEGNLPTSMTSESSAAESAVQSLRKELERLKKEQDAALSKATYLGLSPSEATELDQRRRRIYEIYESLLALERGAKRS